MNKLSKAEKPPKGFSLIPGGKKGGYRKRSGKGFVYWYPDTGKTSSPKEGDDKPRSAADEGGKTSSPKAGDDKPRSAADEGGKRMKVDVDALPEGVQERLEKYNLSVVTEAGGDPEKAVEIAKLLERGISESADLCKQDPPVCAGNMGIPRSDMPQIMDDPIKKLLASKKEGDRKKGQAAVDAGADPDSDKSPFEMMLDHFREQGISISDPTPMNVGELKATQRDIQAKKATGMAESAMDDSVDWSPNLNPIVISNDNHILDGHHRWAAMAMLGGEGKMKVIRVDLPMAELLDRSFDVPGAGVFRMDLQNNVVEGPKPDYKEYKRKADANLKAAGQKMGKSLTWGSILDLAKGYGKMEKAEDPDEEMEEDEELEEDELEKAEDPDEEMEEDEDEEMEDEEMDKSLGFFHSIWLRHRG